MRSVYSEPSLPQNKAKKVTNSGDQTVDGTSRLRERLQGVLVLHKMKSIVPMLEPVGLKKSDDKYAQAFSQPKMSDLWYTHDVQEDPFEDDDDDEAKDFVEENLHEVKLVKTVIDTKGKSKRRAFTMDYEWVPDGKSSTVELTEAGAIAALEFLTGDLVAMENTMLLGEITGEVNDVKKGGKLIPSPAPPAKSGEELTLTHGFYVAEDNVKILQKSEDFHPFTVTRKEMLKEEKFPTPGEFLGMAVRAWPNHAWFSQESNPFMFAANWFETNHYSGGLVKAKNDISDDQDGSDFDYEVMVRGKLKTGVISSDFKEYEIDDRVAILKRDSLDDDELFTNLDMKENEYNETWIIVPITFYQEE